MAEGSRSVLPPPDADPVRLLSLTGRAVADTPGPSMRRLLSATAPDAVVGVGPQTPVVRAGLARDVDVDVLIPGAGRPPHATTVGDGSRHVMSVPSTTGRPVDRPADPADAKQVVCLTDRLTLNVDPYRRTTAVDGLSAYAEALPPELPDGTVHCSTRLRAGFRTTATADGRTLSLVGVGRTEATLGVGAGDQPDAAVVEIYSNGAADTTALSPDDFGLTGLDGVGETRAETLRRAGYRTVEAIAGAPTRELATLDGIGSTVASGIRAAATAQAENRVVPTGDDSLPNREPIFVDIETDGLEPSVVWLVGVLTGGSEGRYMPFTEGAPGTTGHLEAFLAWLDANAGGRPLVAWNGYRFDFPVLETQIRQHHPEYADLWEGLYTFDPLWWARRQNGGNAALPGRTDTLEAVAEGLGWTPATTGLDGATVAAVYNDYRRAFEAAADPATVDGPDWRRLEAYCEDDVRALAVIYGALDDAARGLSDGYQSDPTGDGAAGTQGALSDFS